LSISNKSLRQIYPRDFFDGIETGALGSAEVMVPYILGLLRIDKVIDVGCGRGIWLDVYRANGINDLRGVDGPHVLESGLLIPPACFTAIDLSRPFELEGRYDLAQCLEVAEHLPIEVAPILVRELTRIAPLVLFSAAIPGQGGEYHINEQWPEYWQELFDARGFVAFDPIRPRLLHDKRVCWWYRQNVVLYVSSEYLLGNPTLRDILDPFSNCELEWIHRDMHTPSASPTVGRILSLTPVAVRQSFKYRLQRFLSRFHMNSK